MHYVTDPEKHAAIFGPKPTAMDDAPGRSRKCKSCGDWHRLDKPWPHNCRPPKRQMQILEAPQLAPGFDAFVTGMTDTAEIIGSRNDKREYMKRNDLVEHDTGVDKNADWVENIEYERELVQDIKRFSETPSENLSPDLRAQKMDKGGSLDEGTEINIDDIEVAK
jgi:hypothetical protein